MTTLDSGEIRELGQKVERSSLISEQATDHQVDGQGRRVYWALAYDATATDRHGTRMSPSAFNGTELDFPILAFHNKESYPVGKPVDLSYDHRGLSVGFVFADTPEAQQAEQLVGGGFLRGVSVGFIPLDGYRDKDDDKTVVFTEAELVELSLTPTPSSRKALIDLSRSLDSRPDPEDLIREFDLRVVEEERDDDDVCAFCGDDEPCFCTAEFGGPEYDTDDVDGRAVSLTLPSFMRASLRRGLKLHEEGHSGSGLKPETVAAARKGAEGGEWSVDKHKRCAAWIARHLVDLDAYDGEKPTPGLVAMLLWGGGSTRKTAERAAAHCRAVVESHSKKAREIDDAISYTDAIEALRNHGLDDQLISLLTEQVATPSQEALRGPSEAAGGPESAPEGVDEGRPTTLHTERSKRHRRTARSNR